MTFVVSTHRARLFLVAVALAMFAIGYGIHQDRVKETLIPDAWIWLFSAAALSALAFAWTLRHSAYLLSGVVIPMVLILRVVGAVDRAQAGVVDFGRVFVSFGTYGLLGISLAVIWIFLFKPLVRYWGAHR